MSKMVKTVLAVVALAASSLVFAGDFIPNEGGMLAMGCNGADGMFGPDSQGLGCRVGGYQIDRETALELKSCEKNGSCDDDDDGMLAALPEHWYYWMPIQKASGTVTLVGDALKINGAIFSETERVGISDRMKVLSWSGSSANVIYRQKYMTITLQVDPDTGAVDVGSEDLGYLLHATSLN